MDSKVAVKTVRKAPRRAAIPTVPPVLVAEAAPSAEELHQLIAVTAYYLAERRNFEPGHELEDWLSAEALVRADSKTGKGLSS